ncbi:hypothetical protein CAAN1_33S00606 [[Candida] anglica]|uniref:DNA topoisomerase (ATP-hydrolyzing) n=1 Tax=[Candida] anglica TaxID=148631 RepID=A0ABP0E9I0_9ASCO
MKHQILLGEDSLINNIIVEVKRSPSQSVLDALEDIWIQLQKSIGECHEVILVLKNVSNQRIYIPQFNCIPISKFTIIVRLIKLVIQHLKSNSTSSVRDIYYKDVALFQNRQQHAKIALIELATSLGVTPEEGFQIVPSQKGLVYGNIQISGPMGFFLDSSQGSCLIPLFSVTGSMEDYQLVGDSIPIAIIILEKEAIYRSVCETLHETYPDHKLLIITGKGFPCKLTLRFIQLLTHLVPKTVPILAFVDSDIYGIQICQNYRYPKNGNICERVIFSGMFLLEYQQGWLDTTFKDWKRMQKFLLQEFPKNCKEVAKWKREISRGMVLFKKSEMNVIQSGYTEYMLNKVNQYCKVNYFNLKKRKLDDYLHDKEEEDNLCYLPSTQGLLSENSSTQGGATFDLFNC